MKRWYVLAAAPLVAIGVFFAAERRHEEAELARIRADITALSRSIEVARQDASLGREAGRQFLGQLTAAPGAPAAAEPAPREAAPNAEEAPSKGASPEVRRMELAEVRDRLEATFAEQRLDPTWTGEAQRTAETRLRAAIPAGSSVRAVECRASMCRIETAHEDVIRFREFAQNAFIDPEKRLWNGGSFSTTLADPVDGKLLIVSYLGKDGEALPMPRID